MNSGAPGRRGALVVTLAVAGVAVAHALEYALLVPDGHDRHHVLAHTGHGYLPHVQPVLVFLAIVGLGAIAVSAFRAGALGRGGTSLPIRWRFALPAVQVVAFIAVEIGERLAAHASLADVGLVLAVGLPIQILLGVIGGRLIETFEHVVRQLGAVATGSVALRPPRTPVAWLPASTSPMAGDVVAGAFLARGPPLAPVRL